MKSLLNKDNIKNIKFSNNKFGITERDLVGNLKGFPLGVVVRMLEETERQGNKPDIKVFLQNPYSDKREGGFHWFNTEAEHKFWEEVIRHNNFDLFYRKYPKYKKYDVR